MPDTIPSAPGRDGKLRLHSLPWGCFFGLPALVALLIAILLLTGCGKKGQPLVPKTRDPLPIMDLKATGRGGAVTLYFTIPSENIDGSPFRDLKRIDVYRRLQPSGLESSSRSFFDRLLGKTGNEPERIFSIKESELIQGVHLLGRRARIIDNSEGIEAPQDWYGHVFEYFVFTKGGNFRKSPPSNIARAMPLLGPKPPEDITAECGDAFVKLTWEPQTELTNGDMLKDLPYYSVYRVPDAGWRLIGPLNEKLLPDCNYLDQDVVNDTEYRYVVTTVAAHGELFAESATSATVIAMPKDNVPPSAPYQLDCVAGQGFINLFWMAEEAPDHLGYLIYRKKAGEDLFMLLTPQPILRATYRDETVRPDTEYSYYVTAVDNSTARNESGPSNTVSAKAR
ncbi:MAG: fibronectin type III domain-containing protein [Candidatus Coatesbacteria bacterium]|nr:fibronectin type III domain-containing protein [Candidatus Coatesbacteria bacterium]